MSYYVGKYYQTIRQIRENPYVARFLNIFHYLVHQSRFSSYIRTLLDTAIEAIILIIIVYVLCIALLYLKYMMWGLYQLTPMGNQFMVIFEDTAHAINKIMSLEFWHFALKITVSAFLICIGTSAICWFSAIGRIFYLPMGSFAKLLFWGLPLSAAVTLSISETQSFSSMGIMSVFTIVPTMCLFMNCFNYTERLVPEISDLISEGCRFVKWCAACIKNKIEKE